MKRTITTKVFAFASPYNSISPEALRSGDIANELLYSIHDMSNTRGYILVGSGTVTVELDEPNDVAATQVQALREQIKAVEADAKNKVDRLQDTIRNLQCLTYEAA